MQTRSVYPACTHMSVNYQSRAPPLLHVVSCSTWLPDQTIIHEQWDIILKVKPTDPAAAGHLLLDIILFLTLLGVSSLGLRYVNMQLLWALTLSW